MKRWILAAALCAAGSIASTALAQPAAGGAMGGGGMAGGGMGGMSGGQGAAMHACHGDIEKLCAGVQPGGGRIGQCLREHKEQVSEGCKAAIGSAAMHHREQGGAAAQAPVNPPN